MKNIILILTAFIILSCATRKTPAPIINATSIPSYINNGSKSYNGNSEDGDVSTLDDNKLNVTIDKVESKPIINNQAQANTNDMDGKWLLPTQGSIIKNFSNANKGIDFSGKIGQDIIAVSYGKVLYSGIAKGYGNLIIIKHDKAYLTAYAFNQNNLVKAGDTIRRGQKIATMGGDKNGLLHFELRLNGKPINPNTKLNIN